MTAAFDVALAGEAADLHLDDGRVVGLSTPRWHRRACAGDRWLVRRCTGATLDLGCGPGRLVEALFEAGVAALGIDCSPVAVDHCRARGVPALCADLFGALPAEGHWRHVVFADGNIGIGGDPHGLLRRAAELLRPGGSALVEVKPGWDGLWQGQARLSSSEHETGIWFPWAVLDLETIGALTRGTGLRLTEVHRGHRHFARLTRQG
nr:class I SAM-dependent methyltransferase [Amycolatopsis sp. 195334CR]